MLAFIELPDFGGPLNRIAGSAEKLAGFKPGEGYVELPNPAAGYPHAEEIPAEAVSAAKPIDGAITLPPRADASTKHRERAHA